MTAGLAFQNLDWAYYVLAGAAALAALVWVCWRSRSWHVLLARLWWLLHGSRQPEPRVLRRFYADRTALMHFRWITGVRARTLNEARSLAAWCVAHDEEIGAVRACGRYFDRERPGLRVAVEPSTPDRDRRLGRLRLPGCGARSVTWVLLIACVLLLELSVGLSVPRAALVSVKGGDGTPLWLYADHVAPWRAGGRAIQPSNCAPAVRGEAARLFSVSRHDLDVICQWFSDPGRAAYVARTVRGQRILFIALGMLFLWSAWMLWRHDHAIEIATQIRNRLRAAQSHERGAPARGS